VLSGTGSDVTRRRCDGIDRDRGNYLSDVLQIQKPPMDGIGAVRGGPGAIRRVGDYIRQQGSVVSAFYSSNVEVYLSRRQMVAFCEWLATLPSGSRTWFIGSKGLRPLTSKLKTCPPGGVDGHWS